MTVDLLTLTATLVSPGCASGDRVGRGQPIGREAPSAEVSKAPSEAVSPYAGSVLLTSLLPMNPAIRPSTLCGSIQRAQLPGTSEQHRLRRLCRGEHSAIHRGMQVGYWITSSARVSSDGEMVRPRGFAAFEVDDQLVLGRQLNRKLTRICSA